MKAKVTFFFNNSISQQLTSKLSFDMRHHIYKLSFLCLYCKAAKLSCYEYKFLNSPFIRVWLNYAVTRVMEICGKFQSCMS